jgi:hypothetical protein
VLTLEPNTPAGTYTIEYTICEVGANPVNCATTTASVVVGNVLNALDDIHGPIKWSSRWRQYKMGFVMTEKRYYFRSNLELPFITSHKWTFKHYS